MLTAMDAFLAQLPRLAPFQRPIEFPIGKDKIDVHPRVLIPLGEKFDLLFHRRVSPFNGERTAELNEGLRLIEKRLSVGVDMSSGFIAVIEATHDADGADRDGQPQLLLHRGDFQPRGRLLALSP